MVILTLERTTTPSPWKQGGGGGGGGGGGDSGSGSSGDGGGVQCTVYKKPQILQVHCLVLTITGDICWIVRIFRTFVCTIIESKVGSSMKHIQIDRCWELKNTFQNIAESWKLETYIYIVLFCFSASNFRRIQHNAIWAVQKDKNNTICMLTFWHRSFTFNSNQSPTWRNNFPVYYPDVCLQLNMFWAFSRPSSGAQWLQW